MRVTAVLAAGLFCLATWVPTQAATPATKPPRQTCTVQSITDGDSFQCTENNVHVRLLLIDSPEREQSSYHRTARQLLEQLLARGTVVKLELDKESEDSFGRILAYVWLADGRMANEEMVRAGLALAFPFKGLNRRYWKRIAAAQLHAQKAGAGFWRNGPVACSPQQFRHKECTGFQ